MNTLKISMAFKNVFTDSDVLLDLALLREPFYQYTQLLLHESTKNKFRLSTSSLVVANMNYILSKRLGTSNAKEKLKSITNIINILPFENDAIDFAFASKISDFEDAIQCFIAEKHNCEIIVTRNLKDYKNSTIPALTPEHFLRTL